MNEISGSPDEDHRTASGNRGQSEVLGVILLLGAVIVGAMLTVAIGGMALQSLQDSTEGGLTQDTAIQAHAALSEAATTGEPQSIPMGDGPVDAQIVDGGEITISMHDGSRDCAPTVREDLGALRYEGGDRAMIFEGGAIWAETESGLAIERAPPITHDEETTRISVLSVSAAATSDDGELIARPNRSARQQVARQTAWLLTTCPAGGFTDLRITVTSPYSTGWKRHFQENLATTSNVTVSRVDDDTVRVTIENATDRRELDGLGLVDTDAPTSVALGENVTVGAHVANGNVSAANATVELAIDGTGVTRTDTLAVGAFDVQRTNLTVSSGAINASLVPGRTYNYTVSVANESGAVVDTGNGSFVLGTRNSMVRLSAVDHTLDADEEDLTIDATLQNDGLANGTANVTLEFVDEALDAPNRTASDVPVAGTGSTTVGFDLDVAALPIGHYEYAIHGPNRTATGAFVVANRSEGTPIAGDLRVRNVSASGTSVLTGDPFAVTTALENVGTDDATGTVALAVEGGPTTSRTVALTPGERRNATLTLDASALGTLAAGETHNYTVTVDSGNDTETLAGSFYLGEPGSALGVEGVTATETNGTVVVAATLDNDGSANGTADATLTLYDADGDPVSFASTPTATLATRWGGTRTATFELDGQSLRGNHTAVVAYGNESGSDVVDLGSIDGGDGGVAISGAGNGTVTVLGTEVSAEYEWFGSWRKRWAPIGVDVVENRSGVEQRHPFTNDETAMDLPNEQNLNTYDTQFEEWAWEWEQDAGETMRLTLSSTYWRPDFDECDSNTILRSSSHTRNGPGYDDIRTWTDYHPDFGYYADDCVDPLTVDATSGDHPSNVRVLTDGASVPDISRALPDQRTAAEVLNQGAEDRIDPDTGELTLSPNEAVFLFEMTDPDATWAEAHGTDGDPDYNDVIALVEFETPNGSVPVDMDTGDDGTGLVIEMPTVGTPANGSVSGGNVTTTPGSGAPPGTTPGDDDAVSGGPSMPDDVDVEVDVIQLG